MRLMLSGVAVAILGVGVHGQAPIQTPSPTQVQRPAPASGSTAGSRQEQVSVVGCVLREADYRKVHDAGRGGAAGTGVGVGNEFVLAYAEATPGAAATGPSTPAAAAGVATALAYELTGSNEGMASNYVGRRAEVFGRLKGAETNTEGPTGGPTAGAPPRGVDVASKDLKLRELEVLTIRAAAGTCPAL